LRTVFKDGPNQGRLFYSCGKAGRGTPASERCDFFAWCPAREAPHTPRALGLRWQHLDPTEHPVVLKNRGFLPGDVRQGKVGDCWFIAALAVVAERDDLISSILDPSYGDWGLGRYAVRFFFDGEWEVVVVDGQFPHQGESLAFARGAHNQLWPSLIEKAYAKAHGSYDAISGGFISEAMLNLTGWPTVTFVFNRKDFDADVFFAQLLSFVQAGFPLGCSTSVSQQGLVGCHAYSLLDVRQIDGARGVQMTLVSALGKDGGGASQGRKPAEQNQLRLLKIRNPWGRREWSGEWSARSDAWTERLKAELGHTTADDGVFWMEYGDFLAAFDTVDVCKARRDWSHRAQWPTKRLFPALPQAWPANALDGLPQFTLKKTAEVSVLLVQPTKRGKGDFRLSHSSKRLWYSDLHVVVVRNEEGGGREVVGLFSGAAPKVLSLEMILPAAQYTLVVFSLSAGGGAITASLASSQPLETSLLPKSSAVTSGEFLSCVRSSLGVDCTNNPDTAAVEAVGGSAVKFKRIALRPGLDLLRVTGPGTIFFCLQNRSDTGASILLVLETTNMEVFLEEQQHWVPPHSGRIVCAAISKSSHDFQYTYQWGLLDVVSPPEVPPRGLFQSLGLAPGARPAPPPARFLPSGAGSSSPLELDWA